MLKKPLRCHIYSGYIPVRRNMIAPNWSPISIGSLDLETISKSLNFTSNWKDCDNTCDHN